MIGKVLIFGGGGFVGGNLATIARQTGWTVSIADSAYRPGIDWAEWNVVDITSRGAVRRTMRDVKPDAVVNVAAIANIDLAEKERDLAWSVNVEGARYVAEGCAELGARLVFFSSDAVFAGTATIYTEDDEPAPVNYYGLTKAEAERGVLSVIPDAAVTRLSLVMGFPVTGGNSFFAGLEGKLEKGQTVSAPVSEIRTPVDVITLSECVLELAGCTFSGLLHIGATSSINRYDLTQRVARRMGFDEGLIVVAPEDDAPGRAPRHRNGIISVAKAQSVLRTRLLSVDEGIERAFDARLS
ncbi:MAG: NAD(P)-dependent oxidoreductase [Chloroflexi bacterium]|nr:NAD(P)-dependent oxidoreductase [Chloroflexota bacterium]